MPSIFANIGKQARDLLGKGFEKAGHKLTAKSTTSSGVNFSTELQHDASKNNVTSKVGLTYKCNKTGLQIKKFEVNQDGTFTTTLFANDVVDNTKLVLDTVTHPMDKACDKVEVGVEYVKNNVAATLTVSPIEPTTVDASINFAQDNYNFGAQFGTENLLAKEEGEVSALDKFKTLGAVVGYTDKNSNVNLSYSYGAASRGASSKTHNLGFNLLHQYDADTQLVTVLGFSDIVGSKTHSLEFGGKYNVDADSHFQAKFNASKKTTDVSYSVKLRPSVTMVASTNFSLDVNDSKFADATLGLGFTFGN